MSAAPEVVPPVLEEQPAPKLPEAKPEVEARKDVRGQVLMGQRFITRESGYEGSLWETWNWIKSKYHRYGFAHVAGKGVFNDTDGINGGKAFLEMEAELVPFLYELAGHVPKAKFWQSLRALQLELARINAHTYLERVPLWMALASQLYHDAELGLKRPKENAMFDLDIEKIFSGWYALNGLPPKKKEAGT